MAPGRRRPPAASPAENAIESDAPAKSGRARGRNNTGSGGNRPDRTVQVEQAEQVEASPVPKKRGRPPKTQDPKPEEPAPDTRPRKRRKAAEPESAEQTQSETRTTARVQRVEQDSDVAGGRRSPRNRPSGAAAEQRPNQEGRKSRQENRKDTTQESSESTRSNSKSGKAAVAEKQKRSRETLAEVSLSNAQNQTSPPQTEQTMKRNRGRPDASDNTSSPREPASAAPTRRSKPISEHEPQRHPSSPEPAPPGATTGATHNNENNYTPFLTTLTRSIPRSTIASKWTPLDAPSISAIEAILTDCTLPILHRLRDRDARYAQAQSILTTFSARLRSKLAKGMPFPPPSLPATSTSARGRGSGKKGAGAEKAAASHAAEFDFEQTVAAIAGLERALDPLLHSVELLKAEKEREERALERDYAALRELEGNARAQARGWKEGEGKGRDHPLAAGVGGGAKSNGGLEVVVPKGEEVVVGGVFKDLQDEEELLALSQQISSHMESMQNNLGQIQGILPAIAKSRAALQGTLCEYLDPEQYEQVVLG